MSDIPMMIDSQFFSGHRQPLTAKQQELLSAHQQRLYNQGMISQGIFQMYLKSDQQLAEILPAASGAFAAVGQFFGLGFGDVEDYLRGLRENKGPLATQLRLLARAEDLLDGCDTAHQDRANMLIQARCPKRHQTGIDLLRILEPYMGFHAAGLLNFVTCKITGDKWETEGGRFIHRPIVFQSADEMRQDSDCLYIMGQQWFAELVVREDGESVGKMYFEGTTDGSPRYKGTWVYNHLEQDYYLMEDSMLSGAQLEAQFRVLFMNHGWTAAKHGRKTLDIKRFCEAMREVRDLWPVMDFAKHPWPEHIDWRYRPDEDQSHRYKPGKGDGEDALPLMLRAKSYASITPGYSEWVERGNPEGPAGLSRQDRHCFYGEWKPLGDRQSFYVKGCYDTGSFLISTDRDFHSTRLLEVTDSVRYALVQWLKEQREEHLQLLMDWFEAVSIPAPEAYIAACPSK
jgi:hypothetical protein